MVSVTTATAHVARRFIYYRCNVANMGKLKHCVFFKFYYSPAVDSVLCGLKPLCNVVGH